VTVFPSSGANSRIPSESLIHPAVGVNTAVTGHWSRLGARPKDVQTTSVLIPTFVEEETLSDDDEDDAGNTEASVIIVIIIIIITIIE